MNTEKNFYIIMDLSISNLEEVLQIRNTPFSFKEIKEILTQLNEDFKVIQRENIIIKDMKLSNFLIFFEKINNIKIKFSDFDSSKLSDKTKIKSINLEETPLTSSPEVLNIESISKKSDIWSLGTLIYYMYFKEYPFNGETDEDILNEIESNKKLKEIEDKDLNDLVSKMLIKEERKRISWKDYFNHSFFKVNSIKEDNNLPHFNFLCKKHSKDYHSYCFNCKCNLCDNCLSEHDSHEIISFCKIGLTNLEANVIKVLINEIEENINNFNKMKNDIKILFNKMELINDNSSIYYDDSSNNYKEFYIEYLITMNEKIKQSEKIKIIGVEEKKPNEEE
jgi:serine/threonine protein kinase